MTSNHSQDPSLYTGQRQRKSPQQISSAFGSWVKCGATVTFWCVVAAIVLAAAAMAVRAIVWAVHLTTKALGG
jgi:hypothetical protein